MKQISLALAVLLTTSAAAAAHQSFFTAPEVIHNSPEWKGERFADGRPKVPDTVLDRMKNVTLEEAWDTLRRNGFLNQYEGGWNTIFPDYYAGLSSAVIGAFGEEMVDGGMSVDSGRSPALAH